MKANPDKCNFMISSTGGSEITVGNTKIQNSESEKLLGVRIDKRLKFDNHVKSLCDKASQKVNALSRIAPFMKQEQKRIIMNSFIKSHFCYCPIVWMFHSRFLNNRINRIHERSLRIVYHDYFSSFKELLTL